MSYRQDKAEKWASVFHSFCQKCINTFTEVFDESPVRVNINNIDSNWEIRSTLSTKNFIFTYFNLHISAILSIQTSLSYKPRGLHCLHVSSYSIDHTS